MMNKIIFETTVQRQEFLAWQALKHTYRCTSHARNINWPPWPNSFYKKYPAARLGVHHQDVVMQVGRCWGRQRCCWRRRRPILHQSGGLSDLQGGIQLMHEVHVVHLLVNRAIHRDSLDCAPKGCTARAANVCFDIRKPAH
jgi:hypothetical protein